MAYIGEGDDVSKRLYQHARSEGQNGKDFWDRAIVLTSKDANLTKAHARYLESKFIQLGQAAGRATLVNSTAPPLISLPEADVSDMEYFISQAQIVLPVLGVNLFRGRQTTQRSQVSSRPAESPVFILELPRRGLHATAQVVDGEFTILAGAVVASTVKSNVSYKASTSNAYAGYASIHRKLCDDGSIRSVGENATTTRDLAFSSPSTAGAIVTGRSCNGRQAWQTADGLTFGAWESEGVVEDPP